MCLPELLGVCAQQRKYLKSGICVNTGTLRLVAEPMVCLLWWMRSEPKTLLRVDVVCAHRLRWDVLAPMCREAIRSAKSELDDERASIAVELEGQQVNLRLADTTEMRKRTGKAHVAKHRNSGFSQSCDHLVA